jgi:methionyl aminopeptidase
MPHTVGIVIKNLLEIARMRDAGRVVAAVLDAVEAACVPGTTTADLNRIAARELERHGARSPYLGYAPGGAPPYPAVLCTSIDAEVVHGIPDPRRVLREGQLIGIDFACVKDGWCADAARTVAVGVISAPARALLETTRACLDLAIAQCVPRKRLGDIGAAIERRAAEGGYGVVRAFTGHGIGRAMHEDPQVPNHGMPDRGARLKPGLTIAIEPMLTEGDGTVRILDDGWTVVTADRGLSAHFEHTVAITDDGPVVLTAA